MIAKLCQHLVRQTSVEFCQECVKALEWQCGALCYDAGFFSNMHYLINTVVYKQSSPRSHDRRPSSIQKYIERWTSMRETLIGWDIESESRAIKHLNKVIEHLRKQTTFSRAVGSEVRPSEPSLLWPAVNDYTETLSTAAAPVKGWCGWMAVGQPQEEREVEQQIFAIGSNFESYFLPFTRVAAKGVQS